MTTLTAITELLVGLACLAIAVPAVRRPGRTRLIGVVLGVAGLVAVVNAVVTLAQ
jgi:hypothetical protein